MLRKINRLVKGQRGQGMTEYIIIVSLIAIACLVAVGVFGSNIRNMFVKASSSLASGKAEQAKFQTLKEAKIRTNTLKDANQ